MTQRDRGLANALLGFVAMLVVAALLYTLMDPAAIDIFNMADSHTTSQQATDVISERQTIWDLLLYYAIFVSGLMVITRSVFESRRPG